MSGDDNQLDLLQTDENDGCEDAPTAIFPATRMEKRGPGRPKGAKNKKTQSIEKLYHTKGYRDPLLFQGEIMSSHPLDLHRWFIYMQAEAQGIDRDKAIQAFKDGRLNGIPNIAEIVAMQTKVADQLTPYLYGKKPVQEDNDDEGKLPVLMIDLGEDSATTNQPGEDVLSIGMPEPSESEENQSLSEDQSTTSHGSTSHETANLMKDKGE
jgi:hypothetical protein